MAGKIQLLTCRPLCQADWTTRPCQPFRYRSGGNWNSSYAIDTGAGGGIRIKGITISQQNNRVFNLESTCFNFHNIHICIPLGPTWSVSRQCTNWAVGANWNHNRADNNWSEIICKMQMIEKRHKSKTGTIMPPRGKTTECGLYSVHCTHIISGSAQKRCNIFATNG